MDCRGLTRILLVGDGVGDAIAKIAARCDFFELLVRLATVPALAR